jgi:hypothetical protein
MPFVQSQAPGELDTSELAATPPPQSLPAYQDDTGTGANGPKYSTGEFWSGVARHTIPGEAITDIRAASAAGYNPLGQGEALTDPSTAIPEDMKPYADKYVGLYTKEEIAYRTFQLRQAQWDDRHGGQSKWSGAANLAAGLVDPVGVGSMFIPVAGETRLANAIRMAAVGAGVSATDEALMSQLDPNWSFANSMADVGAGTLISGILGGIIRPHASTAELGQLRARLQEDFNAPTPEPARTASGDSAASIAADIRAAVETHAQGLTAQADQAHTVAQALDPAAAQDRLKTAQEALSAVPRETTPEVQASQIDAEKSRLSAGTGVSERLAKMYGDKMPEVLESRAQSLMQAQRQSQAAIEREIAAAREDLARIERAKQAQTALQQFHETQAQPTGNRLPEGYTVGEGVMTDELRQQFEGLRSEVPAEQGARAVGRGEPAESVSGGPARRTARGIEGGRGPRGEPLPVYRGGRGGPLTPEHFTPESFGAATGRPSSGLGVFFTNDRAEAQSYGQVTTHHLDIRRPLEIKAEDLPGFDSIQEATQWREAQRAKGYDGLVIDASHMGGQTWYVPFEHAQVRAPEEIAAAEEQAAKLAAAATPPLKRAIGDEVLRDELKHMAANETGWAQVDGKMIRRELNGGRGNEYDISRTSWIPNEKWWPGRPGNYSPEQVKGIIDKALNGERLGPKQQQLVEYMTEVADQRRATHDYLPTTKELSESGLETHEGDAYEAGMVARLAAIDEDAVEALARHFEDNDVGFMSKVKELLDAHDTDAKLSFSGPQEQEPLGFHTERGAAGRPPDEAGARGGSTSRSAAAETERPASNSAAAESADQQSTVALAERRQQADIAEMLAKLPPEVRAPFEARIEALEEPGKTPIYAAPGESTAGAESVIGSRERQLQDYSLARGGRVLGKALGWFAPGSRALSSPSLAMRKTMARLIETPEMLEMNVPSPDRPFGAPTPIAVQTLLKKWEGNWAMGFAARDQIYREYRARPQAETEGPKMGKHEFNEAVSMAMRRNDQWYIDEVQKAARATRAIVFDPLKVEAQKLGLLPMQEDMLHGTAESYLMRQYDRSKIQKDQIGWHQTLLDGFVKQGVDAGEAGDIAHAVTRNILGTELGLLDTDKAAFHNVPQSGRLLERQLKLPDIALEKYLTNDIDSLSHSYLKSLAPQVEMIKMFRDDLRNDGIEQSKQAARVFEGDPQAGPSTKEGRNLTGPAKEIVDEYAILKQRALANGNNDEANALDKRLRSDLRDLAAVRDRLYGIYGAPGDSASWLQRAGRIIRSVNALRLLGTATWSHVPDLANIVMKRGLPRTMAMAAKLSSSLEALNMNREQMHRIGTVLDMIHNTTAAALGEFGVESNYAVQKALNRATRAFTIATLEIPWIATCKAMAGAAAHDEVLEAAARAEQFRTRSGPDFSKNERIRFNQMGLDQNMLERINEQFGRYGKTVDGVRFGMSDQWHDQGAAQAIDAVTSNAAEASTLSPGAGDTPLWTSSEVGKAIFQFKTFGAVAIRRVTIPLAQGLAHGDLRSAQGLATLIAAGALTYTMKQLLSGQPIEKDKGRYALEVLDKSNLLGWTGEYFYPSLWQFGMGNFSRWGDRQTWETLGGPVAGTAVDAWDLRLPAKLIGTTKRAVTGMEPRDSQGKPLAQVSRSDIHRVRRMLPGNQVWYLRRAVNALEGHAGDAMNLPPAPVSGSTE